MANYYVRSTTGSDANDGSTWALAKATLAGAAAVAAAGDTIYVSQAHAESQATAMTLTFAGTPDAPVKVLCANDAAQPPTASATSATVTTTSNSSITISGSIDWRGVSINVGSGNNNAILTLANGAGDFQYFSDATLAVVATGSATQLRLGVNGSSAGRRAVWDNVYVSFGRASTVGVGILPYSGELEWNGGGYAAGTAAQAQVFKTASNPGRASHITCRGVDFSALNSDVYLTDAGGGSLSIVTLLGCRLPSGWTGAVSSAACGTTDRIAMIDCDSAGTNYRQVFRDVAGSVYSETTNVRTGGATDGTTPFSYQMATNTAASEAGVQLRSPPIMFWNETVGSALTLSIEFLSNIAAGLDDSKIWLEVTYPSSASYSLTVPTRTQRADYFTAPTAHPDSLASWGTTGFSTPKAQKLQATITPQMKGPISVVVCLAQPSIPVFIDPLVAVS